MRKVRGTVVRVIVEGTPADPIKVLIRTENGKEEWIDVARHDETTKNKVLGEKGDGVIEFFIPNEGN
jgi:hypothetical protein